MHSHATEAAGEFVTLTVLFRQTTSAKEAFTVMQTLRLKSVLAPKQVVALLGVDMRLLAAFPTARGLARHMQQAAGLASRPSTVPGQVGCFRRV